MFFIMYGYKSVWIRSLSDVEVRKSCIKEVYFPEKGCHLGTNRSDNET